ncbi:MAG: S8 family serine peptidase, partial [Syntrophobacterales bacterium]
VVSNSWGLIPYTHGYPDCDPLFNAVIDNLELAGPVVVFAAGNEGSGGLRIPADRIETPVNTFAVGALNQDGTSIASFSSRGPSGCDNRTVKPEVTAVGNNVRSSVPGGGYRIMSGTSMACPHVAGAVLLLREVKPEATVDEIKYALYLTAFDLGDSGEDNTFGMGRIDVVEAANAIENGFGTIDGHVTDGVTEIQIEGAVVRLEGTGFYSVSDSTGYYSILAPAGTTYQVVANAFGYRRGTEDDVYLPRDTTVTVDFELVAADNGILQGTVTDSDGELLEDVTISFLNAPLDSIETDTDGFYQITLPGYYAYDIKAEKLTYTSEYAYEIYIPEGGVVTQDFELEPGLCFLNAAAQGTAVEADLGAYREARRLLSEGSPLGTEVRHLYQEHTAELAAILLHDPALHVELRSMISRLAPIVRSTTQGEDLDRPVLSDEDEAAIHALLDGIELVASPRLKAAIKSVRTDIRTLKGMTIGQVSSSLR